MKVLHYTFFGASPTVRQYLYANGLDPDTQYLPDIKFLTRILAILVSQFHYKPHLTMEQFFKYGFAEQKMLLCCDAISAIKRKHRELKTCKKLNHKRSRLTRSLDTSRFSKVSHRLGQATHFKYERMIPEKTARISQEKPDLTTPREKSVSCSFVGDQTTRSQTQQKQRAHSFEVTQRLLGMTAYQVPNRHNKRQVEIEMNKLESVAEPKSSLRSTGKINTSEEAVPKWTQKSAKPVVTSKQVLSSNADVKENT